ncbi:ATP-binding cassette domain-containing protein [Nocardia ignorata]|uniref:ABC-2 type transport system ATP-binding protein n=1 Tax=Nocardia ignorata TaxID=145285 RepID=A0A4R6PUP3_NOCIG|nr:ATP-binding cassette domain-containing protein [Nocardia ignorata]TDP42282.1 ABC-2 type transport system ATP-binding protein [Nocardia ignorata]
MRKAGGDAVLVRGVGKVFDQVSAVDGIDFAVPSGAVTALVGPTGAGKTTLLRMVLGLQRPSTGRVEVTVGHGPAAVGAVLHPRGLHPARTVRDQLSCYAPVAGVGGRRVEAVLETTGLGALADTVVAQLNPGQQTRLALATALLADPPLLVLDDLFADADGMERGWLQEVLRGHVGRGGTVLVSAGSLADVVSAADHLVVLSEGAVVWQGTPAKLRRGHPDRLVVASSPSIALATALATRGFTDAVMRPDGRLAVAEADEATIRSIAEAASVRIGSIVADPIHPDRVLASLTKPRRHQHRLPTPSNATFAPAPPSYGVSR